MPNDLAITYMSGESFCRNPMVRVYMKSLLDHFPGRGIILTHDMGDAELVDYQRHFSVLKVPPPQGVDLFRYRWKVIYAFLEEYSSDCRFVFATDCRDVLWQRDPVPDLEQLGEGRREFAVLCHEGVRHEQCPWNTREQTLLRLHAQQPPPDFRRWEVVNGGIVAGTYSTIKELAFFMYSISIMGRVEITDQAFLNYLYHDRRRDPGSPYVLADPFVVPFVATGNTIKTQETGYAWEAGTLVDAQKRPFALFHQWDRTPYRSSILTRWGTDGTRV